MNNFNNFECKKCGINTLFKGEYYSLTDELWIQVNGSPNGMLCIGCVESILKRKLIWSDFIECPLNDEYYIFGSLGRPRNKSLRLLRRQGHRY